MSLPFSIGDMVEIDEGKIENEPELVQFLGRPAKVETMGLLWVKVSFQDENRSFIISTAKLRSVPNEDAYSF